MGQKNRFILPVGLVGNLIIVGLCLTAVGLWFLQQSIDNIVTSDLSLLMLTLGRITGVLGLVLYSISLVLTTRLRIIENMFGGLNRVYHVHHVVGGLALVFLSVHPLFLSLQYISTSLREAGFLLIPNGLSPVGALFDVSRPEHQDVLQQWAIFAGIVAFWGMVVLLILTLFIRLPYRTWLFSHKFLGFAFFVGGLHMLFVSSDTTTNLPLKYYLLSLAIIGLISFIYRSLLSGVYVRRYKYRVVAVSKLNQSTIRVSLEPFKRLMSYKPGQFVFLKFNQAKHLGISNEWHPFSISSVSTDSQLEITIKALGDYTNALSNLTPGITAVVEGAYGKFTYYNYRNLNQVWIAGGIGITPFLSMLKSLPTTGYAIDLYYSVRDESEAIEWQRIAQTTVTHKGSFRVIPFDTSRWQKHLDVEFIRRYSQPLETKDFFICGPPMMMKSLKLN